MNDMIHSRALTDARPPPALLHFRQVAAVDVDITSCEPMWRGAARRPSIVAPSLEASVRRTWPLLTASAQATRCEGSTKTRLWMGRAESPCPLDQLDLLDGGADGV